MSNFLIAAFFALGAGAWIYTKVQHRTLSGQTGLIVAGVSGFFIMLVFWSLLNLIF